MLEAETTAAFLDTLASRSPTPGGGSASALVGGVAAALCGMVGRLNDKKSGEAGPLHDTIESADQLLWRMKSLVNEDAAAFTELMASWRLPEDDTDRDRKKEAATIGATEAPLTIMEKSVEVMRLAVEGLNKSKKNCLSDAGVAGFLAHAAVEGARLNVMINLPGINDAKKRDGLGSRARALREEARTLRAEIDRLVAANYDA